MAALPFVLLLFLLGISSAAPTWPASSSEPGLTPSSWYTELMELVCDDVTVHACTNRAGYVFRYSVFDPVSRFCKCSTSPSTFMARKKCSNLSCPTDRAIAYYSPDKEGCFCQTEDFLTESWKYHPDDLVDYSALTDSIFDVGPNNLFKQSAGTGSAREEDITDQGSEAWKRQVGPTQTLTTQASDTPLPAFIPPPKKDITPELINQSLAVQPQNTALVGSVIPQFLDDVLTFLVQLAGIVPTSLAMNASTTFHCGSIGATPQPDIMLAPKYVQNGSPQTLVANCRCIAVNMYDPNVITYWIRTKDGSVFSLLGSNKVFDIDQIDTTAPIALSLIGTLSDATKRANNDATTVLGLGRRQVFKAAICDRKCPKGMEPIPGNLMAIMPECGCLATAEESLPGKAARGLSPPDAYSATMTEEACNAMECINNGGESAIFNPFSMTCWCADPTYVKDNPSAWSGSGTN